MGTVIELISTYNTSIDSGKVDLKWPIDRFERIPGNPRWSINSGIVIQLRLKLNWQKKTAANL